MIHAFSKILFVPNFGVRDQLIFDDGSKWYTYFETHQNSIQILVKSNPLVLAHYDVWDFYFMVFEFSKGTPPVKLKSKLLIGSSPNCIHMKIVSMRPPIPNFKSISRFWQP